MPDGWELPADHADADKRCRPVRRATSKPRRSHRAIREAIERAFGVTLPTAPTLNAEFEIITSAIYAAADQPRPVPVTDDKPPTRTHFVYRIDIWTKDGKNIVEHLAGRENLIVARAAYRAACERWPNARITVRQGARIVEDSRH